MTVEDLLDLMGLIAWAAKEWVTVGPHERRYFARYAPPMRAPDAYASHSLPGSVSTARPQPPWDGEDTAAAYRARHDAPGGFLKRQRGGH